jgi:hypothetical protein
MEVVELFVDKLFQSKTFSRLKEILHKYETQLFKKCIVCCIHQDLFDKAITERIRNDSVKKIARNFLHETMKGIMVEYMAIQYLRNFIDTEISEAQRGGAPLKEYSLYKRFSLFYFLTTFLCIFSEDIVNDMTQTVAITNSTVTAIQPWGKQQESAILKVLDIINTPKPQATDLQKSIQTFQKTANQLMQLAGFQGENDALQNAIREFNEFTMSSSRQLKTHCKSVLTSKVSVQHFIDMKIEEKERQQQQQQRSSSEEDMQKDSSSTLFGSLQSYIFSSETALSTNVASSYKDEMKDRSNDVQMIKKTAIEVCNKYIPEMTLFRDENSNHISFLKKDSDILVFALTTLLNSGELNNDERHIIESLINYDTEIVSFITTQQSDIELAKNINSLREILDEIIRGMNFGSSLIEQLKKNELLRQTDLVLASEEIKTREAQLEIKKEDIAMTKIEFETDIEMNELNSNITKEWVGSVINTTKIYTETGRKILINTVNDVLTGTAADVLKGGINELFSILEIIFSKMTGLLLTPFGCIILTIGLLFLTLAARGMRVIFDPFNIVWYLVSNYTPIRFLIKGKKKTTSAPSTKTSSSSQSKGSPPPLLSFESAPAKLISTTSETGNVTKSIMKASFDVKDNGTVEITGTFPVGYMNSIIPLLTKSNLKSMQDIAGVHRKSKKTGKIKSQQRRTMSSISKKIKIPKPLKNNFMVSTEEVPANASSPEFTVEKEVSLPSYVTRKLSRAKSLDRNYKKRGFSSTRKIRSAPTKSVRQINNPPIVQGFL